MTTQRRRATSKELLKTLSTTQGGVLLLSEFPSGILINTVRKKNTLLPVKVFTQASSSTAVSKVCSYLTSITLKLMYRQEMFYLLTESLRERLYATLRINLVIKELLQEQVGLQQRLSVIQKMVKKPGSDCHLVRGRQFLVSQEQ